MPRRFTWRSLKILYSAAVFLGVLTMTVFNVLRMFATGVNSTKMSKLIGRKAFFEAIDVERDHDATPIRSDFCLLRHYPGDRNLVFTTGEAVALPGSNLGETGM